MVDFVYTDGCRFKYILDYFGEDTKDYSCGKCDKCLNEEGVSFSSTEYIKEIILRGLNELGDSTEASLIKALRGSNTIGINKKIPLYGTLANYEKKDVQVIIRDLINSNFISKDPISGRDLLLTKKGFKFLEAAGLANTDIVEEPVSYENNLELFNLLREARTRISKKFLQSGYLICPDEILRTIASDKPETTEELLRIKGFTQRMFNKAGKDFLEIIELFNREKPVVKAAPIRNIPPSIKETYNLLIKGYALPAIASLRKMSDAVISMQIETIIEYEPSVDITKLYEGDLLETILNEISKGYTEMKELRERLPKEAGYPYIRIALAKYKFTSASYSLSLQDEK
jgi:predicted transcriptional regulator